jgi:membrane associated rhomboid family serine protease
MIPIGGDRIEGGPTPLVTMALLALNVGAFFLELSQESPKALQSFIETWGVVPREYSAQRDLAPRIPLPFWIAANASSGVPTVGPPARSAASWEAISCCSPGTAWGS